MKYFYSVLFLMLLTAFNLQAETLSATTDRTQINTDETILLTVQYDTSASEDLDTSELEQQFTILSRNRTSGIQILNGDASRTTTWSYELLPKTSGTLLIPSFNINGDSSEAIAIEINTISNNSADKNQENIYTETVLHTDQAFVQQQIIVTWRLVHKVSIGDIQFFPPKIDSVLAQELSKNSYRRTGEDGKTEGVIEAKYALFPQKSGKITIPAQTFQVEIQTSRRTSMGLLRIGGSAKPFPTEEKSIEVLPADNQQNSAWLPASSLAISQDISGTNQNQQATAGTAFTRVIRIRADGLTAEQLPLIDMRADGIKAYNEKPTLDNEVSPQGVMGLREDRAAIIATGPGTLTLPAIDIPWYDVDTKQWRKAVLPETTIDVIPGASSPDNNPIDNDHADNNSAKHTTTSDKEQSATVAPPSTDTNNIENEISSTNNTSNQWKVSTVILLALLIIGAVYVYRTKTHTDKQTPTTKPDLLFRKLPNAGLLQAATPSDLKKLHYEILVWAREKEANKAALQHASVHNLFRSLEEYLYSNGIAPPDMQELKNLPDQLEKLAAASTGHEARKPQLENLYQ